MASPAPGYGQTEPASSHQALRDPARVVTAEACGECHVLEYEVWKSTPHQTGFRTLHRRENAAEIANRMGFRLVKRDSLCLRCHYTPKQQEDDLLAVSGVSCESCHGAGRDWIEVHNNYGPGADRTSEDAAHRAERIRRSREAGMRRPSEIYATASSCFECHTVPEERLVNVGGHSTGSAGFELVAWTQGEIRHNFLGSLTGGSRENQESSPGRRRLLYLAGRGLDLEYSLRGMASATTNGLYAKAMSRRVRSALAEVRAMARATSSSELEGLITRLRQEQVVPGNGSALSAAADQVGETIRGLLARGESLALAELDPLIRGESRVELVEDDPEPDGTTTDPAEETAVAAATSEGVAGETRPGGRSPVRPVGAVGETRRHLRPRSSHATVGPGACSGCHADQNGWWFEDRHFGSADRFFSQEASALRIARLYGIKPSVMARGDQLCMDCHGTVVSGKERREVLDGVSCESCHGPAADWLEPHKVEGGPGGRQRPGFVQALQHGKRDLERVEVRAQACADCHYVTDPRLISAGHPTGRDFDWAQAVASIRHWDGPFASSSALSDAWAAQLSTRGPIPNVKLATLPESAGGGAGNQLGSGDPGSTRPPRVLPLAPRPLGGRGPSVAIQTTDPPEGLPPFPVIDDSTPLEQVLRLLAERLEQLYDIVSASEEAP